jgi:hypothetical protein
LGEFGGIWGTLGDFEGIGGNWGNLGEFCLGKVLLNYWFTLFSKITPYVTNKDHFSPFGKLPYPLKAF